MLQKPFYKFFKPFSLGALENPKDNRNISISSVQTPVGLPDYHNPFFDVPEHQGNKPKCVGSAIAKKASNVLGNKLSSDDLYEHCKKIDGIPNVRGTYPVVGAKIACEHGIATTTAYETKDPVKISESRSWNKLEGGYAFVPIDYTAICQAIYQNNGIIGSFTVDYNWFRGIITRLVSNLGRHCVILKGFDLKNETLFGLNSWGVGWIGYLAGKFDERLKAGEFEVSWGDYKDHIYDVIAFAPIPEKIIDEVKKYTYRFTTTMRYGSRGYEVRKLQERLGIGVDGIFGRITREAVKSFQMTVGLLADGIVGTNTRKVLNKSAKSLIEDWALAIQKHEGYYEGSRAYRNHNPANFKPSRITNYMKELGVIDLDKDGFAIFPDYETGFDALKTFLIHACEGRLRSYWSNMTLLEFFSVYAPNFENNTRLYAEVVAKSLGVTIKTRIDELL